MQHFLNQDYINWQHGCSLWVKSYSTFENVVQALGFDIPVVQIHQCKQAFILI